MAVFSAAIIVRLGALVGVLALSACNSSPPPASAGPSAARYAGLRAGVSPPGFALPEGSGCSASIARWQAIQDNDLNSGHVNQKVYDAIQGDIRQASAACVAGKDAEARGMVRSSRVRHGYPEG